MVKKWQATNYVEACKIWEAGDSLMGLLRKHYHIDVEYDDTTYYRVTNRDELTPDEEWLDMDGDKPYYVNPTAWNLIKVHKAHYDNQYYDANARF